MIPFYIASIASVLCHKHTYPSCNTTLSLVNFDKDYYSHNSCQASACPQTSPSSHSTYIYTRLTNQITYAAHKLQVQRAQDDTVDDSADVQESSLWTVQNYQTTAQMQMGPSI